MTGSSFRWRLALGSATLAGGVLLGFTLLSSWLIYQAKLERLDAQLRTALIPLGRLPDRGGLVHRWKPCWPGSWGWQIP